MIGASDQTDRSPIPAYSEPRGSSAGIRPVACGARSEPSDAALRKAREWIERANALRDAGAGRIAEAVSAYDEAIRSLEGDRLGLGIPVHRDELAAAWANQGIAWTMSGSPGAAEAALRCFDKAIEWRETLLEAGDPWFRYNLSGAWINKGDLLLGRGGRRDSAGALAAYDRAIEVLKDAPIGENALFRRRLALGWLHRGTARLQTGDAAALREAIRSFSESARVAGLSGDASVGQVAASAWVGRADALGRMGSWDEALGAARRALAWAAGREGRSAAAAVIGLKGRLVLCAAASRFFAAQAGDAAGESLVAEAIDASEEGLNLAARWPSDARLAPLAQELFRLGAQAYACRQPQFLAEFLREYLPAVQSLPPAGEAQRIASRALAAAIAGVARRAFAALGRASLEPTLATFRELRRAAEASRERAGGGRTA